MRECVAKRKGMKNCFLAGILGNQLNWTIVEDKSIYAPALVWKSIASCKRFIRKYGLQERLEPMPMYIYQALCFDKGEKKCIN